jgi:DNA polymerase-3 subunit alpha
MEPDSNKPEKAAQNFVHLRAHSEYSLRDGILRIKPTMASLADMQMPAFALTDYNNLFAAVKFYRAAVAQGIKPIFGCDLILHTEGSDPLNEFTLLVASQEGYKNLIEIISRSYVEGQVRGEPRVKPEWLTELHSGLICMSGSSRGQLGQLLVKSNIKEARTCAKWWAETFVDSFYIEVQRTGRSGDEDHLHQAVDLADELALPLVATNDVRFLKTEDFEAHETRACIHDGFALADPRKVQRYSEQQYLRTAEEMTEIFSDLPEAIETTIEIAKRCNFKLELGKSYLPAYPIPDNSSEDDYLRLTSREGLSQRLKVLFPDTSEQDTSLKIYWDRLEEELNIIIQMGFPGYFLIVMDFIRWAKDNKIPVGPGRGSGAGSLVAYALKITDLDPIHYDLLFERFLNPERVSLPDFDIDFCMEGRDRVIDYVAEQYGREAVSQIVTFGTMAAKAVVKDVARVQGKPYGLADRLSKMIPFEVGMTLSLALEQEKSLQDFLEIDSEAQEIWDMAIQLEGIAKNCGKHAGGVVIAPTKLTDFSPLYCDDQGGGLVTQYDKDDVESVGLVKFDFLGLKTLTIIDWAVAIANRKRKTDGLSDIEIDRIPLDDQKTFESLQRAETTAVFQLESRGMKDLIKRQLPSNFEDIVALVALFRPGPLQSGMVDDFINRKHGREQIAYPHPTYQHEDLQPVLEPTYGIILYQEQVMQIAQVLAGYSLGDADLLRRAMGKKKPEEMAKQRKMFMEGAEKREISEELSSNIFDLMEKFAGYGFNKSHSAAYALVAYQTAWLKSHYPAEFMAAVMSADMQNTDKIVGFIDECERLSLDVTPPDVNTGEFQFSVNKQGQIVYGLGAIKGLGENAIQSIIDSRQLQGPYSTLYDFCGRVDQRKLNRRGADALLRAGAMDRLTQFPDDPDKCRAVLESQLEEAMQIAEQVNQNQASGMVDMFGEIQVSEAPEQVANTNTAVRAWTMKERLQKEKETLGLYLTGHPVEAYADELKLLIGKRLCDLRPDKKLQWLGGLLVDRRVIKTKRGDQLCILTLDDRSARIEVTLFSDLFASVEPSLIMDTVIAVEGTVQQDDYSGGLRIRAEQLMPLLELRSIRFNRLRVDIGRKELNDRSINSLRECLEDFRGGSCAVRIKILQEGSEAEFELGDEWKVEPRDDLLHELRHNFGSDAVALEA